MGTRNLTMVINKQGEIKVAQYGQWDGYPSGQGLTTLQFCSNKKNLKALEQVIEKTRFFNRCNDIDRWIEGYETRTKDEYDMHKTEESKIKRTDADIYWFENTQTRDLGASILYSIITIDMDRLPVEHNKKIYLRDTSEFGKNSLFCEWAYCINFKTRTLQCFEGFNTNKELEYELFKTDQKEIDEYFQDRDKYYGIKLVAEYKLNKLPDQNKFLKDLGEEVEE